MTPVTDRAAVVSEALHTLYAYRSDDDNPSGEGRYWWHEQGRDALADLEAERDALRADLEAAQAQADKLAEALLALVAAVEPLMASKPTEIMPDGLLRYDWTEPLYALSVAIVPARAALAEAGKETALREYGKTPDIKGRIYELAAVIARLVCVDDVPHVDDPDGRRRLDLAANELGHLLRLEEPEFDVVWVEDDLDAEAGKAAS